MASFIFYTSLLVILLLGLGTIIFNDKLPRVTEKNLEDFSFEDED